MRHRRVVCVFVFVCCCAYSQVRGSAGNVPTYPVSAVKFILPTFDGTIQHLNLACSVDGTNWNVPELSAGVSWQGRDFSIIKLAGPVWWIAFTGAGSLDSVTHFWLSSTTTPPCQISPPAVWSTPISVSTAGALSGQTFTWAPEWFVDPADSSLHALVAILNCASGNACSEVFELHPSAGDPTQAWSAPAFLYGTGSGTGNNPIDPFAVKVGSTYFLWYKQQNGSGEGCLEYASASSFAGPYTAVKTGDWAGWSNGSGCAGGAMEGPALIQLADRWRVYFDYYTGVGSLTAGQIQYSDSFDSWATWSARQPIATAPAQAKHGTVIAFP